MGEFSFVLLINTE